MAAAISTDFLAIVALCFTICLAKRNIIFNHDKNKIYILITVTNIILLLLEIATVLMEHSNNSFLIMPHRIANILGFSLCPVIPVLLIYFNKNSKIRNSYRFLLSLPFLFNIIICILSYKTGWIFFVDAHNQYIRGTLFLLPTIISLFYFVLMVIAISNNRTEYEKDDSNFLMSIYLIPLLGILIQVLFQKVLLIWISISISMLLYYIFLRELQFKYDIQTGIKNRSAFEKEIDQYLRDDRNAAFVMIDLNNLKSINDNNGHKVGDEIIKSAAKIIEESFVRIGKTYRIGGDEFCVICKETPKELLECALSDLDHRLDIDNQKRDIKIILAYGYALYNKEENDSIYSAYIQADKAMYTHKAELKAIHIGRVDE